MKIIYYCAHPDLNLTDLAGYGTHIREMIHAFKALGHEVIPIIMGGTEPRNSIESAKSSIPLKNILKQVAPSIIKRSIKDLMLLKHDTKAGLILEQKIMEHTPDLIYERASYMSVSGVEMAKKHGVRHFLEVNAPFIFENREFNGSGTLLNRTALKKEKKQLISTDLSLYVTSVLRDYFLKKIPELKLEHTMVTPNCINPDSILSSSGEREKVVREKYKLNGFTVIGFVGSIFPYHGVDILIDAYNGLFNDYPETKLLIVGSGLSLSELKQHAETLPCYEHIIFTGNVNHSEVFSYINAMDITVMAKTNWYGSPVKLLEYGAMAKAIVAPDTQSVKDIMTNGTDGLLVKPDKDSVKNAICTYLKHPEMGNKYGQNFKNKILSEYTWKLSAQRILAEYYSG